MEYSADVRLPIVGRDERPRSSAWVRGVAGAWGRRGWLKPPTPEEGSLDVENGRGSILARPFKDGEVAASRGAPATLDWRKGSHAKPQSRQGKRESLTSKEYS